MRIRSLGYVACESPAAREWETFGTEVLGMALADGDGGDVVRLRVDDRHHRLAIHHGERDRLLYLGWDVGSGDALTAAVEHLERAEVPCKAGSDEECAERRVTRMVSFPDHVGIRHELFYGQLTLPRTFRPGRPMSGFVTEDQGLGHAVLVVPDNQQAEDFYGKTMGFRKSDDVFAIITLAFYHCSTRHHSLATIEMPGVRGLHHVMVETKELDDVGVAYDLCMERDVPITMTLGRHSNDRMVSFYARTPSGFDIEYGWGAVQVDDDTWTVGRYGDDIWGHKMVAQSPPGALEEAPRI